MAVTVYKSTDASAPSLTNVAGTLVTVFDAILVNGYGAKAAAGWGKEFSGTNKAAYRPPTGNRHYLRIDDAAGATALVRSFETMSDVDMGTLPSPTGGNLTHGKCTAVLPVKWVAIADARTLYFFARDGAVIDSYKALMFGDIFSYVAADTGKTFLQVDGSGTDPARYFASWHELHVQLIPSQMAQVAAGAGRFLQRKYTLATGALEVGWNASPQYTSGTNINNNANFLAMNGKIAYPDPVTATLLVVPIYVHEKDSAPGSLPVIRGKMRGLWRILHPVSVIADGDTFVGVGELAGKTFMVIRDLGNTAPQSMLMLETSDTWPSSA